MISQRILRHQAAAPPTVLVSAGVLAYAFTDHRRIRFSGAPPLFVDGILLGRVPRLAIAQDPRHDTLLLLHCNRRWDVLAISGNDTTVEAAKITAEKRYPGVAKAWLDTPRTLDEVARLIRENWAGLTCSFCGRYPTDYQTIVSRARASICNLCVAQFYQRQTEHRDG